MELPSLLCRDILVPLDGSPLAEQAIPYVQAVATPTARVTLLQILPAPEPVRDPVGNVTMTADDVLAQCRRVVQQDLTEVAERLRRISDKMTVDVVIAVGDPVERILRVATERGADLIAMTSRGHDVADSRAFSCVVDRVARASSLPMLIVPPTAGNTGISPTRRVRRLVVPLDRSETSAQALPVARSLAVRLGLPIHLVSVIDPVRDAPPALVYQAVVCRQLFDELFAGRRLETQQMIERAGARLLRDLIPATWAVLAGPIVRCILGETCPGDVIVMTSQGRSGPTHWPIDSTAEELVRRSDTPVVLLRAQPSPPVVVRVMPDMPEWAPPVTLVSQHAEAQARRRPYSRDRMSNWRHCHETATPDRSMATPP